MAKETVNLTVAAFDDMNKAGEVMQSLQSSKDAGDTAVEDVAVVTRDQEGNLAVHDPADEGSGKVVAGGAVGALVGMVGGPLGSLVGAGVGGFLGKLIDSGINNKRLKEIGAALRPGTSAVVAAVRSSRLAEVEARLRTLTEKVISLPLNATFEKQLKAWAEKTQAAAALAVDSAKTIASDATMTAIEAGGDVASGARKAAHGNLSGGAADVSEGVKKAATGAVSSAKAAGASAVAVAATATPESVQQAAMDAGITAIEVAGDVASGARKAAHGDLSGGAADVTGGVKKAASAAVGAAAGAARRVTGGKGVAEENASKSGEAVDFDQSPPPGETM